MKLSIQTIAMCIALVAAITMSGVDAAERKRMRTRKRNLIKVTTEDVQSRGFEGLTQEDNAEIARVLQMSMSMSMPSGGGGSGGGGSGDDDDDDNAPAAAPSSGGSGDVPTRSEPTADGEPTSDAEPSEFQAPSEGGSGGEPGEPTPFIAPTGGPPEEDSAASSRTVALAAVATTAMVVPLLL